jgi:hypothetical protein
VQPLRRRVPLQPGSVNGYVAPMRRVRELCRDRDADTLSRLQPPTQHFAGGVQPAGADRYDVGLAKIISSHLI